MYTVCKINGGGTAGKRLHITGWRKTVYAVRKQVQITLDHAQELLGIIRVPLPFQYLAQPAELCLLTARRHLPAAALLVLPMGGNTVFRGPVHFIGADLYLKGLSIAADQGGVQ